jgi:hypothetical protein
MLKGDALQRRRIKTAFKSRGGKSLLIVGYKERKVLSGNISVALFLYGYFPVFFRAYTVKPNCRS